MTIYKSDGLDKSLIFWVVLTGPNWGKIHLNSKIQSYYLHCRYCCRFYSNHFSRRVNLDRDSADKITGRLSVRLGGRNQSAGRNSIKFPAFFDGVGHKIIRILKYQVLTQFQEILYPVKTSLFTVKKFENSKLSSQMFPEFCHSKNWHFNVCTADSAVVIRFYQCIESSLWRHKLIDSESIFMFWQSLLEISLLEITDIVI